MNALQPGEFLIMSVLKGQSRYRMADGKISLILDSEPRLRFGIFVPYIIPFSSCIA
jgi:hypothetical protein